MFSSKALPSMDGKRTTHWVRFLACNADIFREYSSSEDEGRRLTMQLLRSDKVRSDCLGCVGRDDIVRYALVCSDRDRFEEVIEESGRRLETEDSLLIVETGWETWDGGWIFRLNENFVLGILEALKVSIACSKLFNCWEKKMVFSFFKNA